MGAFTDSRALKPVAKRTSSRRRAILGLSIAFAITLTGFVAIVVTPRSTKSGAAVFVSAAGDARALVADNAGTSASPEPAGPVTELPPALLFGERSGSDAANGGTLAVPIWKLSDDDVARVTKYLSAHPSDPKAMSDAGAVLTTAGESAQAVELLNRAREAAPDDPTIAYNHARALYADGQIDEAIDSAEQALRSRPGLDEARLLVASGEVRRGNFLAAEENLRKLARGMDAVGRIIQGVMALKQKRIAEAMAIFQSLLAVDSENPFALYNLGVANQASNASQAAQLYSRALQTYPRLAEAHNNLGTLLLRSDPERAFQAFHQAALQSPDDKNIARNLSFSTEIIGESRDKIAGQWLSDGGTLKQSSTVEGQYSSEQIAIPPGSQISISKIGDDTYQWRENVGGQPLLTRIRRQSNGSFQGPAVADPSMAASGVRMEGTITFWVRGNILMGDTRQKGSGPKGVFEGVKSWKAHRIGS